MASQLIAWMADVDRNVLSGLRLASFRPVTRGDFRVNGDQAITLILLSVALTWMLSFLETSPERIFSHYGFLSSTATVFFFVAGAYAVARVSGAPDRTLELIVVLASVQPVLLLLSSVVNNLGLSARYGYVALVLWGWAVLVALRAIALVLERRGGRAVALLLVYLGLSYVPTLHIPTHAYYWVNTSTDQESLPSLNVEDIFYAQRDLLDAHTDHLLPGRTGVVDLYFVGFGSYARQDVFMKEVEYAKGLFDDRFDTLDRSVMLINNRKTVDSVPIASSSNLALALDRIGRLMDPDEDVLFLFLTSHGSDDHALSVDFWPLELNEVRPEALRQILDDAGIRWRVIVISACYSGGFVEALKDPYTMVMTAAASDRRSFGCGNGNDFTYFGESLFADALGSTFSFSDAFRKAALSVGKREGTQNLTASAPVLYTTDAVEAQLSRLERRLSQGDVYR